MQLKCIVFAIIHAMKPQRVLFAPVCLVLLCAARCIKRESVSSSPAVSTEMVQPGPVQPQPVSPGQTVPLFDAVDATGSSIEPSGTPLPDTAYRCIISASGVPARMKAGGEATIQVSVTNDSTSTWSKFSPGKKPDLSVSVGYHWDRVRSGLEGQEGAVRAFLPENLAPGMSVKMGLLLTAPSAGTYSLRIEPVHEMVAWFSSKKGCTVKTKIIVTP